MLLACIGSAWNIFDVPFQELHKGVVRACEE